MGYSADVKIDLFVNGQRFSVGQCGRGLLIFDQPVLLPGSEGELVLTIDGTPLRWSVLLPNSTKPSRIIHGTFRQLC